MKVRSKDKIPVRCSHRKYGPLFAAWLSLAGCGFASGAAPVTAETVNTALKTEDHSHEADTAKIRLHHLNRLNEKLQATPETIKERCRYESDIATKPPAKKVALTFDDGPEPGQTEFILEVLARHHIPATFFLIGRKAEEHPDLVEKIRASGFHAVGNHSWSHPNFHDIPVDQQSAEIRKTDGLLAKALSPRKLFRYPYGNSSCEANSLLHDDGYALAGWHVDSCDWAFDKTGSVDAKEALSCGVLPQNRDNFVEHLVSSVRAHNGGIVLLHEIHPKTLRQLNDVIDRIKAEGFTFTAITDPDYQSSLR